MSRINPRDLQSVQRRAVRSPSYAVFRDDRADKFGRRYIEGWIGVGDIVWPDGGPKDRPHFIAMALFDRDVIAAFDREVDRGGRRGDVEGDAVAMAHHSALIGAYLVRYVAISDGAIGPDDREIDAPRAIKCPAALSAMTVTSTPS